MDIVLGVCGGIAAYKAVSLARLLREAGHTLTVVPTPDALRFVGAPTWEAISGNRVTTSVHEGVPEVRHVAIGQRAELVVVAPATAHTLAKMAAGLADDLLSNTLLVTRAPVLVAPAMHTEMWQHPATQANVRVLQSRGIAVIGPDSGRLTGGDSGPGRMSDPQEICARALQLLGTRAGNDEATTAHRDSTAAGASADHSASGVDRAGTDPGTGAEAVSTAPDHDPLRGRRIVISAGGTREAIDPVRYIGNRSSGRQGIAIAREAHRRGAEVHLVAANIESALLATLPSGMRLSQVSSAAELRDQMLTHAKHADVVVMSAAVGDYRVAHRSEEKLRKETLDEAPVLQLVQNPDILAELGQRRARGQLLVGFAAETAHTTSELLARGRQKLTRKGCDMLAVNAVSWNEGFESAHNHLHILTAAKDSAGEDLASEVQGSKDDTARELLRLVGERLAESDSVSV